MHTVAEAQIPADEQGTVFKLIHVGPPSIDHLRGIPTLLCCFQPWSTEQDCALSSDIITRAANSCLAGSLVCGSLWSEWEPKRIDVHHRHATSQIFCLEAIPLVTNRLQDIIDPATLMPAHFWINHGETQVIRFKFNNKIIIVPYFELIRTFFYSASQRLTEFFFSQSPLESLCYSSTVPTTENSLLARFCVASTALSITEAQVLAGVLFEPSLRRMLRFAQSHWRSLLIAEPLKAGTPEPRHVGQFARTVFFSASGHDFTYNEEQHFWVDSLEILGSPYNFKKIIFHPIIDKKHYPLPSGTLPLCSDLLQIRLSKTRLINLYNRNQTHNITHKPLTAKRSKRNERYSAGINAHMPHVECGLPWAQLPAKRKYFHGLNDPVTVHSLSTTGLMQSHTDILHPQFRFLLDNFISAGYQVKFLEVNNPNSVFGKNISALPIDNQPPLPAYIHKNLIRTFILAEIQLENGPIFLAHPFHQECPDMIVYFQKQNLLRPTIEEWNTSLALLSFVHNYTDFYTFNRKVVINNKQDTAYSTALIALPFPLKTITVELCMDVATHVIGKFRKRLQFVIRYRSKYLLGMSQQQLQEITNLSSNICRAPDANFVVRMALQWHS